MHSQNRELIYTKTLSVLVLGKINYLEELKSQSNGFNTAFQFQVHN